MNFDKDNITDRVLKKIGQYCSQQDFQPEIIGRVSLAAKSLCMWVRAMDVYGRIYRVVEPKKQRLNAAMTQLKEKQDALSDARNKLAEVRGMYTRLHLHTPTLTDAYTYTQTGRGMGHVHTPTHTHKLGEVHDMYTRLHLHTN
jgi:hypothetical protein